MKARYILLAAAVAALAVFGVSSAFGGVGNGAPSGPHYTLNIHGVAKGQGFTNSGTKNNIFVPLWGNCKIDLQESPSPNEFAVTNPDCVNNPPASFMLPNPCGGTNTTCTQFVYQIWARALTPGAATMYTCYTDSTGTTYCDIEQLVVSLNKLTTKKFVDVSKELLSVCDNATGKTTALFSNNNYDYFWDYDNSGLRLAQLRFYPIPTTYATGNGLNSGCTATQVGG